ncbi:MAG: hypothetical protein ACTTJC_02185 [Campylobacter sp.]
MKLGSNLFVKDRGFELRSACSCEPATQSHPLSLTIQPPHVQGLHLGQMVLILVSLLFLSGCAGEPQIITKTVYKDVFVPISCIKQMPKKPNFIKGDVKSAKELMSYLLTCEALLKGCVNE